MQPSRNIHIIGGTGQMGSLLKHIFEAKGFTVSMSDSKGSNPAELANADVVLFSIPNVIAPQKIIEVAQHVKHDCLLVDLSSVKSQTAEALTKTGKGALAIHMLFGPTVSSIQNQKIIFSVMKDHRAIGDLKKLFEDAGAHVIDLPIVDHERIMAYIQALTHFSNLALAHTLIEGKINLAGTISTPVYLAQIAAINRVITQNPVMMAEIQLENPSVLPILKSHLAYQEQLVDLVSSGDLAALSQAYRVIGEKVEALAKDQGQRIKDKGQADNCKASRNDERRALNNERVAYLGPVGTFCHQATLQSIDPKSATLLPCSSIEDVFKAVANGQATYGVVPAENTIEGTVRETLDYLVDYNIKSQWSIDLAIEQNLLSYETDLKKITQVYSHPQAIAQSRKWLESNLPHATVTATPSTLAAIDQLYTPGVSIIGSRVAAEHYKVPILASAIQERSDNTTRFYIIANHMPESNAERQTLLYMTVYNRVGILRDILAVFADSNVNLSKIESRPSKEKAWDYCFYIQVSIGYTDAKLVQVLNILKQYCPVIMILGEA